ncbi:AsmA family protein [Azospirillum sp. TSA2s]|uniref:AsmA family protein n=1 Tax=Azospirillum sp. TSA2s TaxID=709810 RepID=UPI0010AA12ED|nr:AsmA family protein [Azospirillum sp. TSA2s]QCG95677.1 AsmA family protein [Azospirillum sp. TSA2s]
MRKLLIALAVIVGMVVVAVAALPFVLTGDFIAQRIAAAVKERTGRDLDLRIASITLFPRLKAAVASAALSDVPGSGRPPMVEVGSAELEMPLWPLLHGTVELERLHVDGLRANLVVDAGGRANWDFRETGAVQGNQPVGPDGGKPQELPDLRLGDVRIGNVAAGYTDQRSGQSIALSDGSLVVAMPDLDTPAHIEGHAAVNGRALTLMAQVDSPRALAAGKPTAARGRLASDLFEVKLDAKPATDGRTGGPLSASVPDVTALAAWLGVPNAGTLPVRTVHLTGKAGLGGPQASLDDFNLALDDVKASGAVSADWSGKVPAVTLRASVDPIDLDRFLPAPAPAQGTPAQGPAPASADAGWSDEPIDVSPLRRLNLDAVVDSKGTRIRSIGIGPTRTSISLRDGVLAVDVPDLPAFGGHSSSGLKVDATKQPASYALTMTANGLQAEQLLATFGGTNVIRGTTALNIDVTSAGGSQKALVSALMGTAHILFRDGALRGINIAAILRDPVAAATGRLQAAARETDFAEFGGNFRLDHGVARTGDLRMLAPIFRVEGAGTVSLPDRRLDLRLEPTVTSSLKGQGGQFQQAGVTIPVLVTGSFGAPSIQPDYSGVALSAIKDPAKAAEAVRRLKEGASPADILGGFLGSGDSGNSGATDKPAGNLPLPIPGGQLPPALKDLFGR